MNEREQERELTAQLRDRIAERQRDGMPWALVGLDGFVDEIVHVVDKRTGLRTFERMPTIAALAERIHSAAGRSANIELVTRRVKIGGNGPIMAGALAQYGAQVTYIGALGRPRLNPVFAPLAERCEVFSFAEPAHTDALEFNDGKILLGKMDTLLDVTWDRLIESVGLDALITMVDAVDGIALNNWTMVPHMSDIWESFVEIVCPRLSADRRRAAFFDLADPEKRTQADIERMLSLLPRFSSRFDVTLGLNEREARRIASTLGVSERALEDKFVNEIARLIANELKIHCVLVHPISYSVAAMGGQEYHQDGPTTAAPVITTGGGDHLNAGFFLGSLLGLDPRVCLLMGVCSSGFYVINGRSPSIDELANFMETWREGQEERNSVASSE